MSEAIDDPAYSVITKQVQWVAVIGTIDGNGIGLIESVDEAAVFPSKADAQAWLEGKGWIFDERLYRLVNKHAKPYQAAEVSVREVMVPEAYATAPHQAALAAARAEERERAARIADSYHEAACKWASMYVREFDGLTDSARIAAAIRTTEQEGEG